MSSDRYIITVNPGGTGVEEVNPSFTWHWKVRPAGDNYWENLEENPYAFNRSGWSRTKEDAMKEAEAVVAARRQWRKDSETYEV